MSTKPTANVTSLTIADTNAKTILAVVKSGERTAASVVECNEAFKERETEARFILIWEAEAVRSWT